METIHDDGVNGRRVGTVVKKFSSATIVYFPYGAYCDAKDLL
tara:strand:+ start:262 stop:387 length:126 start_codon:yes stop_codon:yes gene_type:complete